MCSWCFAFNPVLEGLVARLPDSVAIVRVLGGLAPDTDRPMPEDLQHKIQSIWRTIETEVPGTRFNFDFWEICSPRRATHAACRAVIAAALQAPELEIEMIRSIQNAYYREAKNPSDKTVLIDLAIASGLDRQRFADDLDSSQTIRELNSQVEFARTIGVRSFPSLVLENSGFCRTRLSINYHNADFMLEQITRHLECRS